MQIDKAKIRHIKSEREPVTKSPTEVRNSIYNERYKGEYYNFELEDLLPYSKQARNSFSDESIASLSKTILSHGIRQPLTVIPSNNIEGKYEIVSGERRFRAAKHAGIKRIPCIVIHDERSASEISLIENIQREDLHPIEFGNAVAELFRTRRYSSLRELADNLGISKTEISEVVQLSKLVPEIQKSIVENKIINRALLRHVLKEKLIKRQKELIVDFLKSNTPKSGRKLHNKKIIATILLQDGKVNVDVKASGLLTKDQKDFVKSEILKKF